MSSFGWSGCGLPLTPSPSPSRGEGSEVIFDTDVEVIFDADVEVIFDVNVVEEMFDGVALNLLIASSPLA